MLSSLAAYGSDSDNDEQVIVPKQKTVTRNNTPSTNDVKQKVNDDELVIESVGPVGVSNMNYQQISSASSVASSSKSNVINNRDDNVKTQSEKKDKPLEQKRKKQKTNSYKKNLLKQISEHSLFSDDSKKKGSNQTIEQERFLDDEDDDNEDYNYNIMETKSSEIEEEEEEEEKPKLYIPRNNDKEIQNDDEEDDFEFNQYYNEEDDEVYRNLENITPEDNEETVTQRGIPQDVLEEMKRQGIDVDSGNFEILDVGQNGSSKLINVEAERRKALIEKHKRDVFLTKDESDALKQFNFTTEGAGDKNRVKVARTKNQISFLAQQSRGRELEMAERLEKSRQSSSTAKRKYGW